MLEFIENHPDYLFIVIINILVVVKVLMYVKNTEENNNDDDDGGIIINSPTLDLPPGVSLPIDRKRKEKEYI